MSKETTSTEVKEKLPSVNIDPGYIAKLTGILLGICVVVALLLGIVNAITEPIITQMQAEKTAKAMSQVLQADSYDEVDVQIENVAALYRAMSGGQQIGYVVEKIFLQHPNLPA